MPGHLARRFQQIAVAVFHAEVEAAGFDLTPVQYAALGALRGHSGIDQATLAGLIAYDRATMTGVVDRLVQKALVRREPSPRDRRAHVLTPTPAGLDLLDRIQPAVDEAQRIMLRSLSATEAEDLIRLLRKVVDDGNALSRAPYRPAPA